MARPRGVVQRRIRQQHQVDQARARDQQRPEAVDQARVAPRQALEPDHQRDRGREGEAGEGGFAAG
ncbi:hypothetical protein [Variovorax sp. UC122_21]|uniref:hypothetical protein n=1 Tax=Variovorax sp. UC122_21 TaxID=3374554 RepID=UPI003756F7AB